MKLDANLGYRLELLDEVVEQLARQEKPVPKFRDNELTGNLWFIRKFVWMDPSQIFLTVFPRSFIYRCLLHALLIGTPAALAGGQR